ncbi:uncharacterized protein A1O9_07909 [Exophiala aquamarina CBS 119918]|uniref:Uncharacterized protein n=1 Tax=Exophiala aquamarina CBS 119918 TaxID=1182545 RepID=A0A072PAP6_9EURO|nr:uncharacterized protein A1O9_07909 [Exophiala aquamarina CBS 119918]KEF56328.1 hypothetical protein A1O9_07909 [Exophiala aquamarina CBS 119918]
MDWLAAENVAIFPSTYLKQSEASVSKRGLYYDRRATRVLCDLREVNGGIHVNTTFSQLTVPVDPYVIPGRPSSGLIPTVKSEPIGELGAGYVLHANPTQNLLTLDSYSDKTLSAYVSRMCLTNVMSNLVPFSKPVSYNASEYILWSRYVASGSKILTPDPVIRNLKTDTIGSTTLGLGFDLPGRTLTYPEGYWNTRNELTHSLAEWQKGQLYFFANDPSMPSETRAEWSKWGYAKDGFTDNNHFSRKMYLRDRRRLLKDDFIITAKTAAYPSVEASANNPIAVNTFSPVQDVPYSVLRPKLLNADVVLNPSTVGQPDHTEL